MLTSVSKHFPTVCWSVNKTIQGQETSSFDGKRHMVCRHISNHRGQHLAKVIYISPEYKTYSPPLKIPPQKYHLLQDRAQVKVQYPTTSAGFRYRWSFKNVVSQVLEYNSSSNMLLSLKASELRRQGTHKCFVFWKASTLMGLVLFWDFFVYLLHMSYKENSTMRLGWDSWVLEQPRLLQVSSLPLSQLCSLSFISLWWFHTTDSLT